LSLLNISSASVVYGRNVLFRDLNLVVDQRQRWGIVGRNGSGKTTLFRLITGEQDPNSGVVSRASGLRVTMLDQHREFPGVETVWDAALSPYAHLVELEHQMLTHAAQIGELGEHAPEELLHRYGRDLEQFQRADGYTIDARVAAVLQGLGFDPDRARTQLIGTLSGGERGRLGLACQLVTPADLLLLDEPTNHLDLETTQWLEGHLRDLPGSVLIVSHDRAFLDTAADYMLHLEGGTGQTYDGGYTDFVRQRAEHRLSQQRAFDKQSKVIAAEEDFIRRNIAGQDTRQAKGRRRRLTRLPRLSPPPEDQGSMAIRFDIRARGGDQALVADHVRVTVEDRVLLEDFSSVIRRGDVVGLVGPNGAGKSTLLATLLGQRPPAQGSARIGDSVQVAFYRQDLAQVPQDKTLFDIINDMRPAWTRGQVQGHLGRFDFSGDEVLRRAGSLSGGERARVALAMMMLEGANLLVFDEPTNHLDVESIEALEDAIEVFEGTVLIVSHDRALLRALTTRVWALENGRIEDFGGGFEDWEATKADRAERQQAIAKEAAPRRSSKQPAQSRTQHSVTRTARRKAEQAEARVHALEKRAAELEAKLSDSSTYTDPATALRAEELSRELEATRAELEQAFVEWTKAAEAMDQR